MSDDSKKLWSVDQMTKMLEEIKVNVQRLKELITYVPQGKQCLACTRQQEENAKDIAHLFTVLSVPNTDEFEKAKPGFMEQLKSLKDDNVVPKHILVQDRQ